MLKVGITKEKGYLYFVDKNGDISKAAMRNSGVEDPKKAKKAAKPAVKKAPAKTVKKAAAKPAAAKTAKKTAVKPAKKTARKK